MTDVAIVADGLEIADCDVPFGLAVVDPIPEVVAASHQLLYLVYDGQQLLHSRVL